MLGSCLLFPGVPFGLPLAIPLTDLRQGYILSLILGDLVEFARLLRVAALRVTMSSRDGQLSPLPHAPFAARGYYRALLS